MEARHARPHAPLHGEKAKIDIRDLSFFYGQTKSLKNITLPLLRPQGDGLHRPVRLRQVHPAARHQPHLSSFIPTSAPKAQSRWTARTS